MNVTASHGVFVRVRAGINIVTNEATWELQTLDPETGRHKSYSSLKPFREFLGTYYAIVVVLWYKRLHWMQGRQPMSC